MKIFITQKLPGNVEDYIRRQAIEVSVYSKEEVCPRDILLKRVEYVDGLVSLLTNKIDSEVIGAMKKCRVIANVAVGYNNIDVEAARRKKIVVTNTPGILSDATADLTVGLILACARRIVEGDNFMRAGKFKIWMPKLMLGMELRGKTVGIIGPGRIGTETAMRLKSFKTKIIYFGRTRKPEFEKMTGAKRVSLNQLLKSVDIVSIHVPLNESTYHLLNSQNLQLLKQSAILVNTSRGEIVDESALIKLLESKKIFAAGFDVYEGEPKVNPRLFKLKNAVLLPHIGSATYETRTKMAQLAVKNAVLVLQGKKPLTPVE